MTEMIAKKTLPTVAIVTGAVYRGREPEFVRLTDETKERYCASRRIRYVRRSDDVHPDSHPMWCKPSMVMDAMREADWTVWMDADAAITNDAFDLAGYLAGVEEPLVMQRDLNGWNAGVYAARRDALEFVQAVEDLRMLFPTGYREQAAMSHLISRGAIKVREPDWSVGWNHYIPELYHRYGGAEHNIWRRGVSWCLHLPGVKDEVRNDVFRRLRDGTL